jgi:hypothetical protein
VGTLAKGHAGARPRKAQYGCWRLSETSAAGRRVNGARADAAQEVVCELEFAAGSAAFLMAAGE